MKIAAYGIGKNEESNIVGWYEGIKDADYILYLDTGSTDNTVKIAESLGIDVKKALFSPWDETNAKNTALSLIPLEYEYCINLDIDQHLVSKDWKDKIIQNTSKESVLGFKLISTLGLGSDSILGQVFKIHRRQGVYWFGYRPEIMSYTEELDGLREIVLDIVVKDIIGTQERFENREVLYVNSYKNYVKKIKEYRKDYTLFSALSSLALAYYEVSDKENFNHIYDEILQIDKDKNSGPERYLINLAYTLFNPDTTREIYEKLKNSYHTSEYHKFSLDLRLACIYYVTSEFDKLEGVLEKIYSNDRNFESTKLTYSKHILSELELGLISLLEIVVNSQKHNVVVEEETIKNLEILIPRFFSNIGYGKRHQALADHSLTYFKENGYE